MKKLQRTQLVSSSPTDAIQVQREPLSINQLRSCLQLTADGFRVPETAVISKAKYSAFLRYCDEMIRERAARGQAAKPNDKKLKF